MALIKNRQLVDDPFVNVTDDDDIPDQQPVIVSVKRWQANRDELIERGLALGVRLRSDEHPELIAADLDHLDIVALEFPTFRDGRPYSYARLLRGRYGYRGEARAVGDVLMEQLHLMERVGFNAFEFDSDDPVRDFEIAAADFSVWYQPSSDKRATAVWLRHGSKRDD